MSHIFGLSTINSFPESLFYIIFGFFFQNRDDSKGGFGGPSGGANRGQGSGSNFDRGSQEQLGGLGRGGLNNNRYVLGVFEE